MKKNNNYNRMNIILDKLKRKKIYLNKKYSIFFRKILTNRHFLFFTLLLGFMILIYPLISEKYYSYMHNAFNTGYSKKVRSMEKDDLNSIIEQAIKYNNMISGKGKGMYDKDYLEFIYSSYNNGKIPKFFSYGEIISRVIIPKIDVDLPVFYGSDDTILSKGAGLMTNTSLPVGGKSTHSVITAHRGMPESRYFRDLGELKKGDIFIIQTLGRKMAYKVDNISIVLPDNPSSLSIVQNRDYVTLLTCHPYMINSKRLLVRGHRVAYTEKVKKEISTQEKENKFKLFFVKYKEYMYGILIFLLIFLAITYKNKKGRKLISVRINKNADKK